MEKIVKEVGEITPPEKVRNGIESHLELIESHTRP
jgi:hypothetical protein